MRESRVMDDYQEELLELSALEQGAVDGDEDATEL
jgi:hypothetical protein